MVHAHAAIRAAAPVGLRTASAVPAFRATGSPVTVSWVVTSRIWTITAVAILLVPFVPILGIGMDAATRATLGALRVVVAAVQVPAMTPIVSAVDHERAARFFARIWWHRWCWRPTGPTKP
ncbi:DUF6069 family protein [Dactylosporangium sp. NPDC051484]|uniref:DUF6069 family protein n=1 Tax=Dactylosporangium sp. NPDC051484 TaxID=3154942 RepID=UPI00344FFCB7